MLDSSDFVPLVYLVVCYRQQQKNNGTFERIPPTILLTVPALWLVAAGPENLSDPVRRS